ncbi:MAG TPA: hypothetical protein VIM51_14145 [Desulfosporosinus sp.]
MTAHTLFSRNLPPSGEGKLFFYGVRCNNTPVFTAFNDINQVTIQDCMFFSGYTQTGTVLILSNTDFVNGGLITVNSSALANTIVLATGGGTDGSLTATYTVGTAISVFLIGFAILGTLSASGSCNVTAAANSIPIGASFTGGAALTFINDALLWVIHRLILSVGVQFLSVFKKLWISWLLEPPTGALVAVGVTGAPGPTGAIGFTGVIF